jgi:KDO2-lipid IV(A) lauroyltransferase
LSTGKPGTSTAPLTGEPALSGRILDVVAVVLVKLCGFVPRRLAMGLGGRLTLLVGTFMPRKTARIRQNLAAAGCSDPVAAGRAAWMSMGCTVMEMLWILPRRPEDILAKVKITGAQELVAAQKEGKGVLLVSGHIGNWELVPLAVAASGLRMAVVARRMTAPAIERQVLAFRERGKVRSLIREEGGSGVSAYRWLRKGDVLGSMMDRLSAGRRLRVPFLGHATNIPLSPANLACRTGAAVVLGCARRHADGTNEVIFKRIGSEPFTDQEDLVRAVGRALEDDLRSHPEQWFWIYRSQPV